MYLDFYGLRELPFELTPDPDFLFLDAQHREALSTLQHGVQARKGLTLLIGDAGTGKTTLLRALRRGIERAGAYFVHITNPRLTRDEFIEMLAAGFGLSNRASGSKAALLREIEQALRAGTDAGRLTALIVDEAQRLSDELLEEILLLANIETDSVKLLPVVLAGHQQLEARLNEPALWQLKQRVSLRCDLRPLDFTETASYILQRIRQAGGQSPGRLFTREAVRVIYERSRGIPRLINTLCDNALINGFALDCRPVTSAIVLEVCADFKLAALPALRETETRPAPGDSRLVARPQFAVTSTLSDAPMPPKAARQRLFGFF